MGNAAGQGPWGQLAEAAQMLQGRGLGQLDVGIVLGSGLGHFVQALSIEGELDYAEVPHMPRVGVKGHGGRLVWGTLGSARVVVLQGRVHLYEGHSVERAVFGVRLLAQLGVRAVLITNAAGGIRSGFEPGDLMLIRDHINLLGQNPLTGPNDSSKGARFVDLSQAYDARLCEAALRAGLDLELELQEGVYAAMPGPSYETPAEVRMLRLLGADAVGMSTVPEVIALNHLGVPVAALSCISNLAAGLGEGPLSHDEVEATAQASSERFQRVLTRWVQRTCEVLGE